MPHSITILGQISKFKAGGSVVDICKVLQGLFVLKKTLKEKGNLLSVVPISPQQQSCIIGLCVSGLGWMLQGVTFYPSTIRIIQKLFLHRRVSGTEFCNTVLGITTSLVF
jgi:hypothetical protein